MYREFDFHIKSYHIRLERVLLATWEVCESVYMERHGIVELCFGNEGPGHYILKNDEL